MKRIFALLAIILTLGLGACGTDDDKLESGPEVNTESTAVEGAATEGEGESALEGVEITCTPVNPPPNVSIDGESEGAEITVSNQSGEELVDPVIVITYGEHTYNQVDFTEETEDVVFPSVDDGATETAFFKVQAISERADCHGVLDGFLTPGESSAETALSCEVLGDGLFRMSVTNGETEDFRQWAVRVILTYPDGQERSNAVTYPDVMIGETVEYEVEMPIYESASGCEIEIDASYFPVNDR